MFGCHILREQVSILFSDEIMTKNILSAVILGLAWIISLIPLRLLYLISDIALAITYLCPPIRYRKKIVRKNLKASFPDYSKKELKRIEMKFYHNFFDTLVESLKICSMTPKWMSKHMEFVGIDHMNTYLEQGNSIMVYMGHVGNWEWITSLPIKILPQFVCCEVYHPLENVVMDDVVKTVRERLGSVTIPMDQIYRKLVNYKRQKQSVIVGMIADQVPLFENMHYWTEFMNQKTSIFTGAERIARKLDMIAYYAEVKRIRRGHYRLEMIPMFERTKDLPEFEISEKYIRLLEKTIISDPSSWLWSHNRWKRTWEQYLEFMKRRSKNLTTLEN